MARFREKWRLAALGLKAVALEASTQRSYASYRKAYLEFCRLAGYKPVPVSSQVVCEYVAYLAECLAFSSILKYLGIIRVLHEENGLANPEILQDFGVKLVLLAVKKQLGSAVKRCQPVDPELLLRMRSRLELSDSGDKVIWSIILTGFFGLLRISNLLPPSVEGFDPGKHLTRQKLVFLEDCVVILLTWAKNNQFKDRVVKVPIPRVRGSVLCPVVALAEALRCTGSASRSGPAFVRVDKKGVLKPVLYGWFSKRFLDLIESCGLDRSEFGTHSLRRGAASWALKCGISSDVIRILGDWRSDAYQCYLEVPFSDKLDHMFRFAHRIGSGYH